MTRTVVQARRFEVAAPAKVNLVLAVGRVRADGFHPVVSVLQCIDLRDRLVLELQVDLDGGDIDVVTVAPGVPGGDSLVSRAIASFAQAAGIGVRARVDIEKVIPVGAGLGGGSSDAAAALRAMDVAAPGRVDAISLMRIAGALGSDVPSFLSSSGRSVVEGRGEVVTALSEAGELPAAIVAWTGEHAATPEVYRAFDELPLQPAPEGLPTLDHAVADAVRGRWRNDLEAAATRVCPRLATLREHVTTAGLRSIVCGSGSALLVVADGDEGDALAVVQAGGATWYRAVAATGPSPVRSIVD